LYLYAHLFTGEEMNRKDIIRMAREAGGADISMNGWTSWVGTQSTEFLERFATLVASAEREACAKVADNTKAPFTATAIRARGQV
jgi:hypothetical protein